MTYLFKLAPLLCSIGCAHSIPARLAAIKEKTQYALLGGDFGILNSADLAINACEAEPVPFNDKEPSAYQYWKCFTTEDARASCDGSEPDHAIFGVDISTSETEHHYSAQSVDDAENCAWLKKEWDRIARGQKHVCISAQFARREMSASGKVAMHWIISRFKSALGCVSYFEGGCDREYQLNHGCKESLR